MRKHLPGTNRSVKTLADGRTRVYFYAWRGGPMLKDETGEPLTETDPRFFVAYTDAHRSRTKRPEGSMFNLIASFRASAEYTTEISDRTYQLQSLS